MSDYERFARDWVEMRQSEYREDHRNPDDLHDERKDRELTDAAIADSDALWGV